MKTNFPLDYYDWMIISKNLIINSGREYGGETEKLTSTFSVVVSSEMAPGFHIMVYGVTTDDYLVTDSAYFPVQAINRYCSCILMMQAPWKLNTGTCSS